MTANDKAVDAIMTAYPEHKRAEYRSVGARAVAAIEAAGLRIVHMPQPGVASLRGSLLDRFGVPRDCGWTDEQILEHIDLGLRTNSPTAPVDDSDDARLDAAIRDVSWVLNCHGFDALTGMPDDVLAQYLLLVTHGLEAAHAERDRRATA